MKDTTRRKRMPKPVTNRQTRWSEREMFDLATALQKYGFGDLKKISEVVKTKDESAVKTYIQMHVQRTKKALGIGKVDSSKKKSWNVIRIEDTKNWRPVQKWMRIAQNQMPPHVLKQDYSMPIIKKLCQTFHEEAEESTNPQTVNVKAIYKFMMDCVSGTAPSELSPIDSAYVLVMVNLMKDMAQKFDFREESEFIQTFRKATEFVPIEIKNEFRRKPQNISPPGTVPIPIDLFTNLVNHHQVVHSFNPLGVPMWVLLKEQAFLKQKLQMISKR